MEYLIFKTLGGNIHLELPAKHRQIILDSYSDLIEKIKKEEWQSGYNSYVMYDYEPFDPEGYKYKATIIPKKNYKDFLFYILDKRLHTINSLESVLQQEAIKG